MNVIDNVNMEFEARVMLSEKQYLDIKNKYTKEYPSYKEIVNENTYFDTEDLYMTGHHMVLRTRKINDDITELTFKIQLEKGCLEVNHNLTLDEQKALFEKGEVKVPSIVEKLKENKVDIDHIKLITTLKTERIEIMFQDYLFVLDKNYYSGKIDYNLEVESDSEKHAESRLLQIIEPFGVEYKKDYISKSKRAIYNL